MKVVLFGGSGMVGRGVLRECLLDREVERVVAVGRSPLGVADPKLDEVQVPDLTRLAEERERLSGLDACFFCLGTSSVGKTEDEFRRVTYDLTLAVARQLVGWNPEMAFVYVSGAGTDSSEKGPRMWARVKGSTENALLALPFRAAYMFRPGAIRPMHGIRSRTRVYRVAYFLLWPFLEIVGRLSPNSLLTTERVGRAMIAVVRSGRASGTVESAEIGRLGSPP